MKDKPLTCESFADPEMNVLRSALTTAAENAGFKNEYKEYQFLAEMPRTSLVVYLVEAIREHGYGIFHENDLEGG